MIRIRFQCRHVAEFPDTVESPQCPACGEQQRLMVTPSRPPRFRGTVSGPYAETTALSPVSMSFGGK